MAAAGQANSSAPGVLVITEPGPPKLLLTDSLFAGSFREVALLLPRLGEIVDLLVIGPELEFYRFHEGLIERRPYGQIDYRFIVVLVSKRHLARTVELLTQRMTNQHRELHIVAAESVWKQLPAMIPSDTLRLYPRKGVARIGKRHAFAIVAAYRRVAGSDGLHDP
jgi:hypothetical protein